ncbi:hypothetical protein SAMN05216255_4456 [Pseudomonas segetis]|uniref:Phage tail protein n=1 Tax=Pseudomonas segetis TaxID=298908 RepID=A0A239JQG9_9PSED|nr:hypothetical protein SAMN05216255_4456 [Pseudomonas segetis]
MPISDELYLSVIAEPASGMVRSHDSAGLPFLVAPPPQTHQELCAGIDRAADAARLAVAGDPLRATEYERAASEAQAFKDAGYPTESVPRTVAAWAISGRTAQQAADSILGEAAAYTEALYRLRETRLNAKEQVRLAMQEGNQEQAEQIADQAIAAINAAIGGVGNSAGANV